MQTSSQLVKDWDLQTKNSYLRSWQSAIALESLKIIFHNNDFHSTVDR